MSIPPVEKLVEADGLLPERLSCLKDVLDLRHDWNGRRVAEGAATLKAMVLALDSLRNWGAATGALKSRWPQDFAARKVTSFLEDGPLCEHKNEYSVSIFLLAQLLSRDDLENNFEPGMNILLSGKTEPEQVEPGDGALDDPAYIQRFSRDDLTRFLPYAKREGLASLAGILLNRAEELGLVVDLISDIDQKSPDLIPSLKAMDKAYGKFLLVLSKVAWFVVKSSEVGSPKSLLFPKV